MAEPPTVVEVTAQPLPAVPPMPTAPPTAGNPPVAPVPGLPLAVAAANAAGAVATGAFALGGPASLAVAGVAAGALAARSLARCGHRNRTNTSTRSGSPAGPATGGGRGTVPRASTGLGQVPGTRRTSAAAGGGGVPWAGQARPSASGLRAAARTAQHRTTPTAPSAAQPQTATATPATGAVPVGARRAAAGPASTGGGRPGAGTTTRSSGRSAAGHRAGADSRSGSGGWRQPDWVARSVAKGARGNEPVRRGSPGERWPEASAGRAARIAARTEKRLIKGHQRALRKAGLDPATGLTATAAAKAKAKGGKPSAPVVSTPEQQKALRRSAWRYRARMAGAVLGTGLVGLGSVLAGNWRHRGMVASHLRRTWRHLAGRARTAREARDAAIAGADLAAVGEVPVPAETVNDPARTTEPTTAAPERQAVQEPTVWTPTRVIFGWRPQEATMSDSQSTVPAFSLSSAADVMLQAASTFDPEYMTEFEQLVNDLPTAFLTIQDVLRVLAELSAERLPVDPAVVEEIGEGYRAMAKVIAALEEVPVIYRRVHEADIERIENPRNGLDGERRWNVQ